jgi:beta-phosphoglucomutase
MRVEAVILDLDGVVVTTDEFHYQAWQRLAGEEGVSFDRKINNRLRGVSRMESLTILLEKAKRKYSDKEKKEMAARKNLYYFDLLDEKLKPDGVLPGAMDFMEELKAHGIKVAIGSSSKNGMMILQKVGMDAYFDAVVDGNDITKSKPDPEVFLIAAKRLDIEPWDCLVIEDTEAGVAAGIAAGMKVFAVGAAADDERADVSAPSLEHISADEIIAALT